MAEEDVKLTFNFDAFKNGIKKASGAIGSFVKNTTGAVNKVLSKIPIIGRLFKKSGDNTKKTAKDTSKGIFNAFGKLALIGGLIAGAVGLIKKAIDSIPEIGKTFQAVGQIVTKNLLWPLRQELIPVLQRVLDWARNNRGMFLKWGNVLVNVFKTIKILFSTVISLVKTFTKSFTDSLRGLVKFAGKDITQVINLLVFKLTALFILLEAKLQPVFAFLGRELGGLVTLFADFFKELKDIGAFDKFLKLLKDLAHITKNVLVLAFKGLKLSIKGVMGLIKGFIVGLGEVDGLGVAWKNFKKTLDTVFSLLNKLFGLLDNKIGPAFEKIGKIVGHIVGGAFKLLIEALKGVSEFLTQILQSAITKLESPTASRVTNVQDAIIRPDGSIVKTDPRDTLVAMKNPNISFGTLAGSSGEKVVNVNMGNINLNVTEGNAQQAGINFAESLQNRIRQIFLDQRTLEGAR